MKLKSTSVYIYICISILILSAVSCGKEEKVRKYKEKAAPAAKAKTAGPHGAGKMPPPKAHPTGKSQAPAHFAWDSPEGWQEDPTASGFRLATFKVQSADKESVCTIIPLKGEAGGLKANVTRWLGQISADKANEAKHVALLLEKQEKFLTAGQFPAVLIDYTPIAPNDTDTSILSTVVTVQGNSIFIKMTGPKAQLLENKDKFKSLCKSFKLNHPEGT